MAISDTDRLALNEFYRQVRTLGLVRHPLPDLNFGDMFNLIGTAYANGVATPSVGASSTLMSYAMPALASAAPGKAVRITCFGVEANNANSKVITLKFGNTVIYTTPAQANGNYAWQIQALVIKTGAGTQRAMVNAQFWLGNNTATNTSNFNIQQTDCSESDNAPIVIAMSATAVANGDVTQNGMLVEFLN